MNPSNCPDPWVHNPDNVSVESWTDIPVKHIWRNTDTGELLIQYKTITTVTRNNYVESHSDPEKVESRLRKVKDLISTDDVEVELDSVTVTGGSGVAKCRRQGTALGKAMEYMNGNLDDGYFYEQ